MFIQAIEGRTTDPEAVRRHIQRWTEEVAPNVPGWLGTTAGVTDEGALIAVVSFDSPASAKANSERPEQGVWWAEACRLLEGEPKVVDFAQADVFLAGESPGSGFVQVFTGLSTDIARFRSLGLALAPDMEDHRPDETGDTLGWQDDGAFIFTGYYTSEKEAREGEGRPLPADLQSRWKDWIALADGLKFFDLRDPWIWVRP